jgi:SRSO17 transposase
MMYEAHQPPPPKLDLLDVQVWNLYWAEIERRIDPVFARSDALKRAMSYLAGLLSPAERKNSWQLAEISGDPNPYGFQHLLGRADWDADVLRDKLRSYVTDYLADPAAIGVIDETGFLKKGIHSAGVARQG